MRGNMSRVGLLEASDFAFLELAPTLPALARRLSPTPPSPSSPPSSTSPCAQRA